jgi:hypothetical protein
MYSHRFLCVRLKEWLRPVQPPHLVLGVVPLQETHARLGHVQLLGLSQVLEALDVWGQAVAKVLEKEQDRVGWRRNVIIVS